MSLRLKAAFIVIGSTAAIMVPIHWFSNSVLQESFQSIENKNGIRDMHRIRTAFINEAQSIDGKLVDWASWTDTYNFARSPSQKYLDVNLNYESIVALRFDWVLILNKLGKPVFSGFYDQKKKKVSRKINHKFFEHFHSQSPLTKFSEAGDKKWGFLNIDNEIVAFASRPILTSAGKGPSAGTIVFAKKMTDVIRYQLQSALKLSFETSVLAESQLSQTYFAATEELLSGLEYTTTANEWKASMRIEDAYGKPIIAITKVNSREITQTGKSAFQTIQLTLLVAALFFFLTTLFLINRWIISRVRLITDFVRNVEKDQKLDGRLNPQAWDEIGQLSLSLNRMVGSLERSQKDLKRSEERLQLALDASSGAVWDWNMETGEVRFDRKWKEMLGYESSELENRFETFTTVLHPHDQDKFKLELDDYLNGFISNFALKIRMRAKDGSFRWVLMEGAVQRNSFRKPVRMVGWSRDITEEVLQDELVEKQRAQLVSSSKLSALGEMSAGVAHEINNPLAIIQGVAHQLQSRIEKSDLDRDKIAKNCQTIIDTTDRIAKIIRALRNLSRDGSADPKEETSVQRILTDTLSICKERFVIRGIRFEAPEISDELIVYARPTEVVQILVNLLNNASDAVKDLSDEHKWIRIECRKVDQAIEISVANGGDKIPDYIQEKLFQPFFTTKEVGSGTGLGLSIARNLAHNNHGSLTYDSTSRHPRFIVLLPSETLSENLKTQSPHG